MDQGRGLVVVAVLLAGAGLAGTARAEEGVEKALSISASLGSESNGTVRACATLLPEADASQHAAQAARRSAAALIGASDSRRIRNTPGETSDQ